MSLYSSVHEPAELSQWICRDNSTINIGTDIIIIIIIHSGCIAGSVGRAFSRVMFVCLSAL